MLQITSEVNLLSADKILKQKGLEERGPAQLFFTENVLRRSDKYAPSDSGIGIRALALIGSDKDNIIYQGPYAQYHWFGKKMIGPAPKELTDIDMNYQGAPMRGPFWVDRMWQNEGADSLEELQNFVDKR